MISHMSHGPAQTAAHQKSPQKERICDNVKHQTDSPMTCYGFSYVTQLGWDSGL